jgi:hypothetical protein
MVDRWTEIVPGTDVWHSTRQLYDVVVLCIANRSTSDALVEVDAGHSENTEIFLRRQHCINRGGGGSMTTVDDDDNRFRVVVPGCTTRAVATFGVIDSTQAVHLHVRCSLVALPPVPVLATTSTTYIDDNAHHSPLSAALFDHSPRGAQEDSGEVESERKGVSAAVHRRGGGRRSPSVYDIREEDATRQSAAVEEWLQQSNNRRRRTQTS